MYCGKCGKQIEDGRQYCKSCGYNMANSSPNTYSFIQSERKKNEKNAIKHLKDEQNNKPKNKKRIIVILIVALSVVSVIVGALLLMNINKKNENKNTPQVNFDLSQYSGHGNLSCGLIWVKDYQWSDKLDGNDEMFAYFDVDGNQKSGWFSTRDYFTSDFKNDYLELEKVNLRSSNEREHTYNYDIYNKNFVGIASVNCNRGRACLTPFDENGYAFAETKSYDYVFIDSSGVHNFSDDVLHPDVFNIKSTEKYFLLDGECICDHQGNVLVNTWRIVEDYIDSTSNYSRDWDIGESDLFYINIGEIIDGKSIELEFNARNKTSQNMVVFNCKIDFNGNFIESPTKR